MLARTAVLVTIVSAILCSPVRAQTDPPGMAVLKVITVTITSINYGTHRGGICHGSVYAVVHSVAYVITAKHCVETFSSTPLMSGIRWRDIHEVVTVKFPNGSYGRVTGVFWSQNYDALVIKSTYNAMFGRRPMGYVDVCRCEYYRSFPRSARIPILSMLSAGGGTPVPSSGFVQTDEFGRSVVFLSTAHGTSGTLVVDPQGRMVGLVWGVYSQVPVAGGAGFTALITRAPVILSVVKYAFDQDGVSYATP